MSWPANGYWQVGNGKVHWGRGGDPAKQAAYARMYEKLVSEAYGNYGPLAEIWFDGSVPAITDGGPDIVPILRRLQPQAVVFQGPTSSIRWVGNGAGIGLRSLLEHGRPPRRLRRRGP